MLVLSRGSGEEIHLPEVGIVIKVKELKGKSATLGIEAPQDIRILRGELMFDPDQTFQSVRSGYGATA